MLPLTSKEAQQQAQAEGLTLLVAKNKVGYYGVVLEPRSKSKPYRVQVWSGGKMVNLGSFATAEEAALCIARSPEGQAAAQRAAAAPPPSPPLTSEEAAAQKAAAAPPPLTSEEARQQAKAEKLVLPVEPMNPSGYFGVSRKAVRSRLPWVARVKRFNEDVGLGSFATPEEAALCVARSPEGRAREERMASEVLPQDVLRLAKQARIVLYCIAHIVSYCKGTIGIWRHAVVTLALTWNQESLELPEKPPMQETHNGTTEHPGKYEGVNVIKGTVRFNAMGHTMRYEKKGRFVIIRHHYNNESAALVRARMSRFFAYNPNAQPGDVPPELFVVAANMPHVESSAIWVLGKQTSEPSKSAVTAFNGKGHRLGGSGAGRSDVEDKAGAKARGKKRAHEGVASTSAQGDDKQTPICLDEGAASTSTPGDDKQTPICLD